ncbi:hypothetical protein ACFYWD_36555 [Streptomyces sp. NPDC003781]|uniref:hypothetical protein n=1 Tax=Streptomyces sp. NPDC003781 TaxID=3364686 RepID=UPI0036AF814C
MTPAVVAVLNLFLLPGSPPWSLIWTSRNYGRIDRVFVGIITLGILGLVHDRNLRVSAMRVLHKYGAKV